MVKSGEVLYWTYGFDKKGGRYFAVSRKSYPGKADKWGPFVGPQESPAGIPVGTVVFSIEKISEESKRMDLKVIEVTGIYGFFTYKDYDLEYDEFYDRPLYEPDMSYYLVYSISIDEAFFNMKPGDYPDKAEDGPYIKIK
ncbi:MAG: hypothetical protein JW969_04885 [Spirochaetales bacterium]|nr:hypothetical protein [Spirochaetales bacterium]